MIKDLVVNLMPGAERDPAADYAISVATALDAHLAGVAFTYDPVIPSTVMGGGIPADLIEAQRAESMRAARAATTRFEAAAKRASLSFDVRTLNASSAGAGDVFARVARRFDLSVVGQAPRETTVLQDLIIEGALFEAGRPVIVVPYIQKDELKLERAMLCWDGSRAAARAIGDALPFLERAKRVEVVIVAGDRGKSDEMPGADMGEHLARHGLNVTINRIPAGEIDVADAILSYAADSSADFVVMGGYGHSRLREFILGGVTRSMLASMTVPVLLSH